MKIKIIAFLMALSVLLLSFCGCNNDKVPVVSESAENNTTITSDETTPQTDAYGIYAETLFGIYQYILAITYDNENEPDSEVRSIGISEVVVGLDEKEALKRVGYVFDDINNDGMPELLVMSVDDGSDTDPEGCRILAAYTCVDNTVIGILEGTTNSRHYILDDNTVYYESSGGAAYSVFAAYSLTANSAEIRTKDYYFTYPDAEDMTKFSFYHNTIGESIVDSSELFSGSEEDFRQIQTDLVQKIKTYSLTAFEIFAEDSEDTQTYSVYAVFVEDNFIDLTDANRFTADNSESQTEVVFFASGEVYDFSFCKLSLTEDSGEVTEYLSLYTVDKLTEYKPLVVTMTFAGSVPSYGFTYTDSDGVSHRGTITLSGIDGSIVLDIA